MRGPSPISLVGEHFEPASREVCDFINHCSYRGSTIETILSLILSHFSGAHVAKNIESDQRFKKET